MRRSGKYVTCSICGKVCRPGGIGAHMRLKHIMKVKTVVGPVRESSDISGTVSDISGESSELSEARVQRPSDYVKKNEVVVDAREEPIDNQESYGPGKQGRNTWGQTWDQREAQIKKDKQKAIRWLDELLSGKPT